MKIALAQINTTVGDLRGNADKIVAFAERARTEGADLAVFPELAVTGYPPRDLVDREHFVDENLRALDSVVARVRGIRVLVGHIARNPSPRGMPVYNAASLASEGRIRAEHRKILLPTYDVFDEARHFEPGRDVEIVEIAGQRLGITICEDIWNEEGILPRLVYHENPLDQIRRAGVDAILNLSASPFTLGKDRFRFSLVSRHAERQGVPVAQVNLVGGNDDLIFDGNSVAVGPDGRVLGRGRPFEEDLVVFEVPATPPQGPEASLEGFEDPEAVVRALVLGVRDYMGKTGFRAATLGLSGGIDSSVVAALAAEAIGPESVLGVAMPSRISSCESLEDARELAHLLGIGFRVHPIAGILDRFLEELAPAFEGLPRDVTEENLQSRIRGTLLMALSNKFGSLVLSTGNKSELAVGYCTLYGDMNGGLSVIADVPKTLVYEVARFLNHDRPRIPLRVIEKPPSAELRPDQKDTDSLPPYEVLDPILRAYVEEMESAETIAARGFERDTVDDVIRKVLASEYKRRQAAIGLKVTSKAFGLGRQIPIVSHYLP